MQSLSHVCWCETRGFMGLAQIMGCKHGIMWDGHGWTESVTCGAGRLLSLGMCHGAKLELGARGHQGGMLRCLKCLHQRNPAGSWAVFAWLVPARTCLKHEVLCSALPCWGPGYLCACSAPLCMGGLYDKDQRSLGDTRAGKQTSKGFRITDLGLIVPLMYIFLLP